MDSQLYHPLKSSRSIRLLHIDDGHRDDPIRASSFEEVELDPSLSYHALSYTWGSGEAVESIHIRDNVLSVLPNLFDALKKLRAHKYTPIWIDRICINQGDDDERTSQVMLMRDIYRSAKLVLVDLGGDLGPDGVKTIVNLVGDFQETRFSSTKRSEYDFYEINFHPEKLCKYGLPARTDPSWNILRLFLEQPWFSRLWVLQEVVLATDFVVYCGWGRITSTTFLGKLSTITLFNLDRFITGSNDSDLTYSKHRGVLIDKYRSAWNPDSTRNLTLKPPLLELVVNNRFAKCSDPRDRIFALLGISHGTALSDLPPDYTETVAETYLRAAKYFIATGDGAALLYQATTLRRKYNLPSWVPDWDVPMEPVAQALSQPRFVTYVSKIFTTGGDRETSMGFREDANVLVVKGGIFDIVSVLGAAAPEIGALITPTQLIGMVEELGSMLTMINQEYPTGEDIEDVWWRTGVCDRNSEMDLKAPAEYRESLRLWRIIAAWDAAVETEDFEKFSELSDKLAPYFPDSRLSDTVEGFRELKDRTVEFQLGCLYHFSRSRACLTSKGYICRAPITVAAGDVVVVFAGVEVPYLLRPKGQNQYQRLGNCYCHGIMYGEALNMPGHELVEIEII
jgi:hypothetical protein